MIGGVSFQPGQNGAAGTQPNKPKNTGVQEAIKVLSLRLPSVVGSRAIAPQALLESPGSGGNPRVDSVVSQVMGRVFPTGDQPAPSAAPMVPPNTPQFSGGGVSGNTPLSTMMPQEAFAPLAAAPRLAPPAPRSPGITFQNPSPPNMNPPEWSTPPPPPPPGFTDDFPRFDGPLSGAPPADGGGNVMNDFLEFLRRSPSRPMTPGTPPIT